MKTSWTNSRPACKSYDMDILSVETEAEADHFLNLCTKSSKSFEELTYVGATTLAAGTTDQWYWVNSETHIEYPLKFALGQPDNNNTNENCLGIGMTEESTFAFFDVDCNGIAEFKFACHKLST